MYKLSSFIFLNRNYYDNILNFKQDMAYPIITNITAAIMNYSEKNINKLTFHAFKTIECMFIQLNNFIRRNEYLD